MQVDNSLPSAGFFRRFGALFYDLLIIIAIEMIAAGVIVAVLHALMAINLFDPAPYVDVSDFLSNHPLWSLVYSLYLALVWGYFLIFFWTRAGQTLGMRAWRIQIRSCEGGFISVKQSLLRMATSFFGFAIVTVLLGGEKRAVHDYCSQSLVVVLPKP